MDGLPLSPELVLVSPADLAAQARALLPPLPDRPSEIASGDSAVPVVPAGPASGVWRASMVLASAFVIVAMAVHEAHVLG